MTVPSCQRRELILEHQNHRNPCFLFQIVGGRQGAHLWRLLRARGVAGCHVSPADFHRGCVAPRADTPAETHPSCNLACCVRLGHTGERLPLRLHLLGCGDRSSLTNALKCPCSAAWESLNLLLGLEDTKANICLVAIYIRNTLMYFIPWEHRSGACISGEYPIASTLPAKDIFFYLEWAKSVYSENTCRNCEWIALACNFSTQLYFSRVAKWFFVITYHYFLVDFNDKLCKMLYF